MCLICNKYEKLLFHIATAIVDRKYLESIVVDYDQTRPQSIDSVGSNQLATHNALVSKQHPVQSNELVH
ncbi:hypothetical protein QR98_0100000 [Sarcoptes scabiei]|uniref:Uncharacterized protein n=1 Tax=Sarcoptes scabiei TaxID=52283 RepID=A0A132ALV9_SARSC|nr:hypothetical protein QR98_0100000 [Sarcoptes scabiei]